MKTLLISAAAVAALAGPVLAADGHAAFAIEHFAQDREMGDGPKIRIPSGGSLVISTSNSDLAMFAMEKLDNDERGDN
ncbi:MAG: hypothetical protein AAF566_04825 [Pseudomonadota bacterium]